MLYMMVLLSSSSHSKSDTYFAVLLFLGAEDFSAGDGGVGVVSPAGEGGQVGVGSSAEEGGWVAVGWRVEVVHSWVLTSQKHLSPGT